MVKGARIYKMKRGTDELPMKVRVKDDLETGQNPQVLSYEITVEADTGDYHTDVTFPVAISLMGGRFTVGPEHHGDRIKFIIGYGTPYAFETVNVKLYNTGSECMSREIGDLKQGGSTIPAGLPIRMVYTNNTGGSARTFIPEMEIAL